MLATSFARIVSLLATLLPVAAQYPLIGSLDVVSNPKDVPFVALGDVPDLWDVVVVEHATQDSSGGVSFDICGPPTCPSQDLAASVKSRVAADRVVQLRISIQSESDDWDPQKFVDGITKLVTDKGLNGVDLDVASMGVLGIYDCKAIVTKFTTVSNALRTAFGPAFVLSVRGSVWVNEDGTFSGNKCNIPILQALQDIPAVSYISVLPPGWIAAPFTALNGTEQISNGPTFMPVFVDDLFNPDNNMRIVSDQLGTFLPLLPEKTVIDTAATITGRWFDPNNQPFWRIAANVQSAMTCIMNGTDSGCTTFRNKPKNAWPGLRAIAGMPINIDQRIQGGAFGRSMHDFLVSFSPGNANETQSSSGSSKGTHRAPSLSLCSA
ncbi:hypothetical protein EXIGLDRAFT_290943 [Exidia glandulosa HHB12029]|uniref:Chitinase n=1 Tax=Exidia glandulosa HHB12029 TaxID=1314781 RepID=A0A165DEJ6_EXIGL|nr:hypothetical protein EXIGLDRAFT_290943 [Exidia glandulosa HHB12029]